MDPNPVELVCQELVELVTRLPESHACKRRTGSASSASPDLSPLHQLPRPV